MTNQVSGPDGSELSEGLGAGAEAPTLVERLRTRNGRADGFGLGPVCDEAADEIERLRALLKECEPAVYSQHMAQWGTRLARPGTLLSRVRGA